MVQPVMIEAFKPYVKLIHRYQSAWYFLKY